MFNNLACLMSLLERERGITIRIWSGKSFTRVCVELASCRYVHCMWHISVTNYIIDENLI